MNKFFISSFWIVKFLFLFLNAITKYDLFNIKLSIKTLETQPVKNLAFETNGMKFFFIRLLSFLKYETFLSTNTVLSITTFSKLLSLLITSKFLS